LSAFAPGGRLPERQGDKIGADVVSPEAFGDVVADRPAEGFESVDIRICDFHEQRRTATLDRCRQSGEDAQLVAFGVDLDE
jgi:hypothetical protein